MRGGRARYLLASCVLVAAAGCRSLGGRGAAREVRADFDGNQTFSDEELAEQVTGSLTELGSEPDPRASVDDAAFDLELFYRAKGFAYCEVDWTIEGEADRARARFAIAEGPRITIEEITFLDRPQGGPAEEALEALFEGPRSGLLGGGELYFVEDRVRSGAGRVEAALRARGWLDARVNPPSIDLDAERPRVSIRIAIEAGPRYVLAALPEVETDVLAAECRQLVEGDEWRKRVSAPYDPRSGSLLTGSLLDLFARNGYPDARVELASEVSEIDAGSRSVTLRCTIESGEHVNVSAVRFSGNEETRSSFLRSRLAFASGGPYDASAVDEGVRRLYATGLFESVKTRLEGEGTERALVVGLEEADSREVFLEPGFGSYELFRLRAGVREKNVFGSGRQAHADAKVSVRAFELKVGLTDPWFLRTPLSSDLSVEYERREEPSFTSSSRGASFLLTHQPTKASTTTFGYQFSRSDLESESIDEQTFEVETEEIDLASLLVRQSFDELEPHWFAPTSGHLLELGLEYGAEELGSELDFLRATGSISRYHELGRNWIGAASLRGGWIRPLGDDDTIPLQERFFNGGENSVRSYQESELGPKDDDGDPIGGEGFGTFNLEVRHPFWLEHMQVALFGDAGYVVTDHEDFFQPSSAESGTAVGVGLRYHLPVGPVRLDLGYNPDREEDEDELVLHFSLGMAF